MSLEAKKTDNPLTPQRGRLKLSPSTEGVWESVDENGVKTAIGGCWVPQNLATAPLPIVAQPQYFNGYGVLQGTVDLSTYSSGNIALVQVQASAVKTVKFSIAPALARLSDGTMSWRLTDSDYTATFALPLVDNTFAFEIEEIGDDPSCFGSLAITLLSIY